MGSNNVEKTHVIDARIDWRKAGKGVPKADPIERWEGSKTSLRKSIDAFCYACVGEIKKEVQDCTSFKCQLWHVRPFQKGSV